MNEKEHAIFFITGKFRNIDMMSRVYLMPFLPLGANAQDFERMKLPRNISTHSLQ